MADLSAPTGDDLGSEYLRFERRGPVAWCTVDRLDSRNALTTAMYYGIRRAVEIVNRDDALAALVITGTGDVFISGGELRGREPDRWADLQDLMGLDLTPFDAIRRSRKPVVAAVNGLCQGGGLVIAMLADVAVCSDLSTFRAPELLRGIADVNYAQILPAHIGAARARDLLMTGRTFSATEAERWGVVSRVVPHDDVTEEAGAVAAQICRTAPQARNQLKRIINATYGGDERMTFDASIASEEFREGLTAFAAKREPSWVPAEFATGERL